MFFSYNFLLTNQQLEALPDHFGISLFQQYIVKKYELRIFFIDNDYFSMAIFSQGNAKTRVDFRNYDFEQMNRYVPYNLPEPIKEKLDLLMGSLMLKSGSIDMIVSEDDKFYFLEVNPIGQFGMVSEPCNYYIERFIAQKLSS